MEVKQEIEQRNAAIAKLVLEVAAEKQRADMLLEQGKVAAAAVQAEQQRYDALALELAAARASMVAVRMVTAEQLAQEFPVARESQGGGKLPTLPGPYNETFYPGGTSHFRKLAAGAPYYTPDQMCDYARAALAQRAASVPAQAPVAVSEGGNLRWMTGRKIMECELYAAPAPAASVQPADLIGMAVSVDVSTGEDDTGNRLFGRVSGVQESSADKGGIILLVDDPKPNFSPPDIGRDAALVAAINALPLWGGHGGEGGGVYLDSEDGWLIDRDDVLAALATQAAPACPPSDA